MTSYDADFRAFLAKAKGYGNNKSGCGSQNIAITLLVKWLNEGSLQFYDKNPKLDMAKVRKIAENFNEAGLDAITLYVSEDTAYLINGHHRLTAILTLPPHKYANMPMTVRYVPQKDAIRAYSDCNSGRAHTTRHKLANTDMQGGAFLDMLAKDAGFKGLKCIPEKLTPSLFDAILYLSKSPMEVCNVTIKDLKTHRSHTEKERDKVATVDGIPFVCPENYNILVESLREIVATRDALLDEATVVADSTRAKWIRSCANSVGLIPLFINESADQDLLGSLNSNTFVEQVLKNPEKIASILAPIAKRSEVTDLESCRASILGISKKRGPRGPKTKRDNSIYSSEVRARK